MKAAADLCTWLRVLLAPLFAWAVVAAHDAPSAMPLLIYAVAALSDFADGRLARAGGEDGWRGRLFDHGADAVFLFPALAVLAGLGRLSPFLPLAAMTAFALYLADGWRRGGSPRRVALVPSQFGAVAGVSNYVVTGLAAGALWAGPTALDGLVRVAALAVAALNVAAVLERVPGARAPRAAAPRASP